MFVYWGAYISFLLLLPGIMILCVIWIMIDTLQRKPEAYLQQIPDWPFLQLFTVITRRGKILTKSCPVSLSSTDKTNPALWLSRLSRSQFISLGQHLPSFLQSSSVQTILALLDVFQVIMTCASTLTSFLGFHCYEKI